MALHLFFWASPNFLKKKRPQAYWFLLNKVYLIMSALVNSTKKTEIDLNHTDIVLISAQKNIKKSGGIPKSDYFFILWITSSEESVMWFYLLFLSLELNQCLTYHFHTFFSRAIATMKIAFHALGLGNSNTFFLKSNFTFIFSFKFLNFNDFQSLRLMKGGMQFNLPENTAFLRSKRMEGKNL